MGKLQRSGPASQESTVDLPEQVTIALAEIASSVFEYRLPFRNLVLGQPLALSVGVGIAVVEEIFEYEVTSIIGPKGKHTPGRMANRHGHEKSSVTWAAAR